MEHKILLLCLSISVLFVGRCESWRDGALGAKWDYNCDFDNHDISNQGSSGEECSNICYYHPTCNHFSYFNGICYLKRASLSTPSKPANGVICGYIPQFTS